MYDKQALMELVRGSALQFGQFTLASGKQARYYLDIKQVSLNSTGARLVGEGILELLAGELPKAIGGMAIGADPITAAVVTVAGVHGLRLSGFMVRKEPKKHGTQRYIEGPVRPGDDAVIVEDVVTTGESALLAIQRAREFGLVVKRVVGIVDRMEGGAAAFQKQGCPFSSLLTIRDFGIEPN